MVEASEVLPGHQLAAQRLAQEYRAPSSEQQGPLIVKGVKAQSWNMASACCH